MICRENECVKRYVEVTTYLRNLGSWSRAADRFFIILTFPQHIGEQTRLARPKLDTWTKA